MFFGQRFTLYVGIIAWLFIGFSCGSPNTEDSDAPLKRTCELAKYEEGPVHVERDTLENLGGEKILSGAFSAENCRYYLLLKKDVDGSNPSNDSLLIQSLDFDGKVIKTFYPPDSLYDPYDPTKRSEITYYNGSLFVRFDQDNESLFLWNEKDLELEKVNEEITSYEDSLYKISVVHGLLALNKGYPDAFLFTNKRTGAKYYGKTLGAPTFFIKNKNNYYFTFASHHVGTLTHMGKIDDPTQMFQLETGDTLKRNDISPDLRKPPKERELGYEVLVDTYEVEIPYCFTYSNKAYFLLKDHEGKVTLTSLQNDTLQKEFSFNGPSFFRYSGGFDREVIPIIARANGSKGLQSGFMHVHGNTIRIFYSRMTWNS